MKIKKIIDEVIAISKKRYYEGEEQLIMRGSAPLLAKALKVALEALQRYSDSERECDHCMSLETMNANVANEALVEIEKVMGME